MATRNRKPRVVATNDPVELTEIERIAIEGLMARELQAARAAAEARKAALLAAARTEGRCWRAELTRQSGDVRQRMRGLPLSQFEMV
jgi:hypothetical protein